MTLSVSGEEDPPVAVADDVPNVLGDGSVYEIDVLLNDVDPEGSAFTLHSVDETSEEGVSLSINTEHRIEYPTSHWVSLRAGEERTDTFSYHLRLAGEETAVAEGLVTVHVVGVNTVPVVESDSYTVTAGASVGLFVLVNDTDVDVGDTLSVSSYGGTNHVSALGVALTYNNTTKSVVYHAESGFSQLYTTQTAQDSFTYCVRDDIEGSEEVCTTVEMVVTGSVVCAESLDDCGACLNPSDAAWNTSCADCAGVPNGEALLDSCGNCYGGTAEQREADTSCRPYTCDVDEWEQQTCQPQCSDVCEDTDNCSEICYRETTCGLMEMEEGDRCCLWSYRGKTVWAPESTSDIGALQSVSLTNCRESDEGACVWACTYEGVVFTAQTIEVPKTTCWFDDVSWNINDTVRTAVCSEEHPCGFTCDE